MFVDPAVSRVKFDREVAEFRSQQALHHKRGVWLLDATFPDVFVVLTAVQTKPFPMVAFGVVVNFENYDIQPPSVRFVHPVTREALKKRELPHRLTRFRRIATQNGQVIDVPEGDLVQGFNEDGPPFVCLQGIREYHDHPGHTGDSWWLHRKSGVGTLSYILNVLATCAIDGIRGVQVQLQSHITGFLIQSPAQ